MDIKLQQAVMKSRLEIYQAALAHSAGNIDNHIGQIAAAVKLRIAAMQLTGKQGSMADIEETQLMLTELIKSLQHISNNSYILCLTEMDIIRAIELEVDRLSGAFNHPVGFSLSGSVYRFGMEKTIILFRVWQQVMSILTETGKQAGLSVSVSYRQQLVSINVFSDIPVNAALFTGDIFERAPLAGIRLLFKNKKDTDTPNSIILELTTC